MEKNTCSKCGAENNIKSKYCSACGYELPVLQETEIKSDSTETKTKKKKNLVQSLLLVAFVVISANIGPKLFMKTDSIDKIAINTASEINESCPIMIDAETRLDNVIALPDKAFEYNYTLINLAKDSIDTLKLKNYLIPVLVNSIKSNPQMKYQKDNSWTLKYSYKDKKGIYIFAISITPEMYNN